MATPYFRGKILSGVIVVIEGQMPTELAME